MKQQFLNSLVILTAATIWFSSCSPKGNAEAIPVEATKTEETDMLDLSEDQFKTVNIQYGAIEEKNLAALSEQQGH